MTPVDRRRIAREAAHARRLGLGRRPQTGQEPAAAPQSRRGCCCTWAPTRSQPRSFGVSTIMDNKTELICESCGDPIEDGCECCHADGSIHCPDCDEFADEGCPQVRKLNWPEAKGVIFCERCGARQGRQGRTRAAKRGRSSRSGQPANLSK